MTRRRFFGRLIGVPGALALGSVTDTPTSPLLIEPVARIVIRHGVLYLNGVAVPADHQWTAVRGTAGGPSQWTDSRGQPYSAGTAHP